MEEGLAKLEKSYPEEAQILEYSAFGGLTDDEIAKLQGSSIPTVQRHKRFARAFLARTVLDKT